MKHEENEDFTSWDLELINLEDLAVDPLLVTSMWSVIFDPHLLFDLIFYLSGRGVIRSQNNIENVIFRAIWYPGLICQGSGRLIFRVFSHFHDRIAHIN